jgi:diguanylate cyclase (GGDEF)-like protein
VDIKTLIFAMFLTMSAGALTLIAFNFINKNNTALKIWTAAQVSVALSTLFYALRGIIPESISILFGNGLLAVSFLLIMVGIRSFFEKSDLWVKRFLFVFVLYFSVLCFFTFVFNDLRIRSIFNMLCFFILTITLCSLLLHHSRKDSTSGKILAISYAGHAFVYLARVYGLWNTQELTFYSASLFDISVFAEGVVAAFIFPIGFILMINEKLLKEKEHEARTDPLTQLYNRRAFYIAAEPSLQHCLRNKEPISVLSIDIDHFKSINDNYGHNMGDDVLTFIGSLMKESFREQDIPSRFGGEEFVVVLPSCPFRESLQVANRFREVYQTRIEQNSAFPMQSTLSIGLVYHEEGPIELNQLLNMADSLLYEAKNTGRNRVVSKYSIPNNDTIENLEPT